MYSAQFLTNWKAEWETLRLTLPQPGVTAGSEQEKIDVAFRVIADHIRTLSFAIADGIVPSNEGRGYVLRRILRRAVRYGRTIGFHEPFFYKLTDVLVRTMGQIFPEVVAKQQLVSETISREERAFSNTLDRGIELFEDKVREIEELRRSSPRRLTKEGKFAARVLFLAATGDC
jgi:alanyl-tRNA synthetase